MKFTHVVAAAGMVAVVGMVGSGAAQAGTNLVQNGGFETGTFTDNSGGFGYDQILAGGTDLADWTVGNSLAWGLSPTDINVHSGSGYVDLTGIGSNYPAYGTLSQTLATVAGRTYAFSVYANNDLGAGAIDVTAGGVPVTLAGTYGSYGGDGGTTWGLLTGSFKATGAATGLEIAGTGGLDYLIGVDDVSVTASVPEPATWAMMLAGFFGLGAMARRRRVGPAPLAV